jgi:arsenate reductase
MSVVIYHNPDCETSRNTLAMIRQSGSPTVVIDYLQTGWTKWQLLGLFASAGLRPIEALRTTRSPASDLGLLRPGVSDKEMLEAMVAYPILVNRPFVCTRKGVRLCRPSEIVLDILPNPNIGPFVKEDGQEVINEFGWRVIKAS